MNTYKATINWYGELHTIFTQAPNEAQATKNAQYKLAELLGKDLTFVQRHIASGDKLKITKEEK